MLTDRTDDTPGGKYPFGTISYDVLMEAARLLHPLPFMLYVALLVRSAGKEECWPSLQDLAASMNQQIGAVIRGRKRLIEANLLELRPGADGLEHYIVKLPGEELQRRRRSEERLRNQRAAEQRAADHDEAVRNKAEERNDASTRNLRERIEMTRRGGKGADDPPPPRRPSRYL